MMEYYFTFDCGCKINFNMDFEYCPMHKAAPKLLEACKMALEGFRNILDFDLLPNSEYDKDTQAQIDKLAAAIASARGEA